MRSSSLDPGCGDNLVDLASLRAQVARLERSSFGAVDMQAVLETGVRAIDETLPDGGLLIGAVHEISGAAADAFLLHLLARVTGPVLWCRGRSGRTGELYGPGLDLCGIRTGELLFARGRDDHDCLWAMEEALRSGLLAAVVGEPGKRVDLTASRRLQLAAERGRTLGIILAGETGGEGLSPSALQSRWQAAPCPLETGEQAAWTLHLRRCRGGGQGYWRMAV
ncbi:ImuA family protein [Aestuariispira insulae]|uniref:Protein ImuA n=1 Tax=Aestuariispira insulae TaxID=1461337 RepID=A0A3D9HMQ5_9PROT|nr:damage-inducible mutagenesis protein [Aestuariispira insulae]RED50773.1 protein ImuA [Aestuariispira insulae]